MPSTQLKIVPKTPSTKSAGPATDTTLAVTTAAKSANLIAQFGELVQGKLAEGNSTLSSLGIWIRQNHPKFTTLLGAGKLKKRLDADKRFKVTDHIVTLVK